jgi:hypothetical protein
MWERSSGDVYGVCVRYDELHSDYLMWWRMHGRRDRAVDVPLTKSVTLSGRRIRRAETSVRCVSRMRANSVYLENLTSKTYALLRLRD